MIQTPEDLAEELRHGLVRGTAGEALASSVTKSAFVYPPVWRFTVTTVEGKRFDVTIMEGT